jgi:dGTPase
MTADASRSADTSLSGDPGRFVSEEPLPAGARAPACYAASAVAGRGRLHPEPACPTRSDFQRDRDRVVHATAFRRLTHKTQVFIFHEGDHYRTRLTHSLEVAQIARTVARQLRLDEDLAECLALAHDLGHPPFGHAGERALDRLMAPFGGFDHNVQSFRLVTRLERKYLGFDGLNLTWETLEGLLKHNGPPAAEDDPAARRVVHALRHFDRVFPLDLGRQASAEAQVAAVADDIAWHTHDIDDGLRAGLLTFDALEDVRLVAPLVRRAEASVGDTARRIYAITRQLITELITDLVRASARRLAELRPGHPDDIRAAPHAVVGFSHEMRAALGELRRFLYGRLYRHPRVEAVMTAAEGVIRDLVLRYREDPGAMPANWAAAAAGAAHERHRERIICDFVAGMTDRYAMVEHRRLFDATPELR